MQPEEQETEKYDRHTSVMPLAASSNSLATARPSLSSTECEAPISSSPTYQHTPQLLDRKICKQSSEIIEHTAMMDIPSKPEVESIQPNVNVESSQTGVHFAARRPASKPSSEPTQDPSKNEEETGSEEESAGETEDEAELYRELFGVSRFSDDSGDKSLDAPERHVIHNFSSLSTEILNQSVSSVFLQRQPG